MTHAAINRALLTELFPSPPLEPYYPDRPDGPASPDSRLEPSPPPAAAMKGLPILFTALAEADLDQIEDYISAHDPAAAARVRATTVQQGLQCSGGHDVVAMRSNLLANTDAGCPKGNGNFD